MAHAAHKLHVIHALLAPLSGVVMAAGLVFRSAELIHAAHDLYLYRADLG